MNNNNDLPKRKPTRLRGFDYSSSGAYFITICTQNRKNILSTIVGEGVPLPQLSLYGQIVDKWIERMPEKYPEISVDRYVIMPNHIHMLLSVAKVDGRGYPSPTVDSAIGWIKYQCTKEINKTRNAAGEKVFQRSFYDHVVRNYEDYLEINKYIHENPRHWHLDRLYSEK